eukprot:1717016-Prymnesium_polylepis.1
MPLSEAHQSRCGLSAWRVARHAALEWLWGALTEWQHNEPLDAVVLDLLERLLRVRMPVPHRHVVLGAHPALGKRRLKRFPLLDGRRKLGRAAADGGVPLFAAHGAGRGETASKDGSLTRATGRDDRGGARDGEPSSAPRAWSAHATRRWPLRRA